MTSLRQFDPHTFLRDYWQKQPLLIRNALSPEHFSLTPEELAGLACEETVESRLISIDTDQRFHLQHGPFAESLFPELPAKNWTLLVQAVDHHIPELAALLDAFRFIPDWRVDDIMVSYAPPGGSAGPHYDNYDVFLIQGAGTRQWQLGGTVADQPVLVQHDQLRLLQDFQAQQVWELGPGDILYLPPRIAHWGISTSRDCMTYSVGFRSPSTAELLAAFCERASAEVGEQARYSDPDLQWPASPGEITDTAIERVQHLALQAFADRDRIARWFGEYITQPKYPSEDKYPLEDIEPETVGPTAPFATLLDRYPFLHRDPASRFAWIRRGPDLFLYVDGEEYPLDTACRDFAEHLCNHRRLDTGQIADYLTRPGLRQVLLALYAQGHLYFADELYDQDGELE